MLRVALATLATAMALVVAGCGGSEKSAASAVDEIAGLVPADAVLVLSLATDPESDQWQQAEKLLQKFPGRERLFDEVRGELAEEDLDLQQDVLPALGPTSHLVFLDFEQDGDNFVALTQPRDRAKLDALLEKSDEPTVTREVEGWTLIGENDGVLDRFTREGEKLEDADWFADAQGRVEEEGLLSFFANGPAIEQAIRTSLPEGCDPPESQAKLQYAAGVVSAEDDGVRARMALSSEGGEKPAEGESLLGFVPAGAFAYLGSRGFPLEQFQLGEQIRCGAGPDFEEAERMLGVSFDDIVRLFEGGFAFYVRSAPVIPEFTLLLSPEDEAKAVATLDTLAEKLAPFVGGRLQPTTIDGVAAKELRAGPVTVAYGAGDGRIVITTTRAGFEALRGEGDSLTDSDAFKEATDAAGVEDRGDVLAYVDLNALMELVRTASGFADEDIPPEVEANLEPLESFVAWGDISDPSEAEFSFFLEIR